MKATLLILPLIFVASAVASPTTAPAKLWVTDFAAYMNQAVGSKEGARYCVSAVDVAGRDQATVSSVRFARAALAEYALTQDTKLAGVPAAVLSARDVMATSMARQ